MGSLKESLISKMLCEAHFDAVPIAIAGCKINPCEDSNDGCQNYRVRTIMESKFIHFVKTTVRVGFRRAVK